MTSNDAIALRTQEYFASHQDSIYRDTDALFARLLVLQWFAAIAIALWISPRAWVGTTSEIHPHVWAAVLLGGLVCSGPVLLIWKLPGQVLTRHAVAVAQMLTSALFIHLTGGRIETHFHVFGSLAFLAFYRDWRVLVTGSAVVVIDHLLRGGLEVLSALEQSHYDIIFMDCHMPELGGYETSRLIREQESTPNGRPKPQTHIGSLTADAMEGDREKCIAAGMDDYLSKPTSIEDFAAALARFGEARKKYGSRIAERGM